MFLGLHNVVNSQCSQAELRLGEDLHVLKYLVRNIGLPTCRSTERYCGAASLDALRSVALGSWIK